MSFEPEQFFTLAQSLHSREARDGAALRTLISRAYYAALICAAYSGGIDTRGGNSHSRVLNYYDRGGSCNNPAIYDALYALRDLRVKADYQWDTDIKCSDGDKALSQSRKTLTRLGRLPTSDSPDKLG